MLLGTASCSSDMEPTMGGEMPVSFSVSLGDDIDSRTISDGLKANQLKFAVFENGTEITALAQKVPVANKQATVTTKLVKGHTYQFVFWAQDSTCTAYNTTDMSAITVDYAANCNDETRDAFYKMDSFTVTEAFEKTETLTRPFAQINFLASDAAGVVKVDQYQSQVTVTGVPTTLNTLAGTVAGSTDVTFDYATILPNEETLAGYETYKYVAMNYVLAATDKEMKNKVTLTVKDENGAEVNTVTVANCPVQRNYRTNIFGDLFTLQGKFNITIDPIYAGEYNLPEKVWDGVTINEPTVDGETVYITTPEEFAWLNGQNLTEKSVRIIELNADINMGNHPSNARALDSYSNPMRELRFKGNNHTIKGLAEPLFANSWAGGAKVYISDLTIDESSIVVDKDDTKGNVGVGAFIGWPQASSVIDLTNCHVKNSTIEGGHWTGGLFGIAAGYSGTDGPVFEEVTVTNCSVENCTIQGKGSAGAFMGHGAASDWTKVTANGCTFKNNQINGAGSNKTGIVLGTIGAAGQNKTVNGVSHTGGIYINNATVEGNTAIPAGTTEAVTRWAGRIGSKGGRLYKDGVDITQECPDTENY